MSIFEFALSKRELEVFGKPLASKPPPRFSIPAWYYTDDIKVRGNSTFVGITPKRSKVFKWRDKIRDGLSASSAYTSNGLVVTYAKPCFFSWTEFYWEKPIGILVPGAKRAHKVTGFPTSIALPYASLVPVSASIQNGAIAKLHERIRQDASQMNGLVTLGELGETLRMFRSPLKSMVNLIGNSLDKYESVVAKHSKRYAEERRGVSNIKKRRGESAESLDRRRRQELRNRRKVRTDALLKDVSGLNLELQFGLKPLISDVEDAAIAMRRAIEIEERRRRFSVATLPEKIVSYYGTGAGGYKACSWKSSNSVTHTSSVRFVAIYQAKVSGPQSYLDNLQRLTGFTWENFVPALYELLPWSFLIDYVSNLGDLVNCYTTSERGLITCVKTERTTTKTALTSVLVPNVYPNDQGSTEVVDFKGNPSELFITGWHIRRTVMASLPVPTLKFALPGLGSTKYLNVLSLLASHKARDVRTDFPTTQSLYGLNY